MRPITATARVASLLAVAALALLAGLGATAQAAQLHGARIKKRTIPADRIKPNALTGVQIDERRLGLVPLSRLAQFAQLARSAETATTAERAQRADVAETARTAETAETARTAASAETARTALTVNGRDHTAFLANAVRTVSAQTAALPGGGNGVPATVTVACPAGEKAIGGGAAWLLPGTDEPTALAGATITASMPLPATTGVDVMRGWMASGRNTTGVDRVLRVYAICVPATA